MISRKIFEKKMRISGTVAFETAFHIGSGKEGELATDMGVLKEVDGRPILPGSTLKGSFRALAERLAVHLGLKACLLDSKLSGIECVSDQDYRKKVYDGFKKIDDEANKLSWLQLHTCDACRLFGSPLQGARIYFSDGQLLEWVGTTQVRDGVCIERDSETARSGAKYDYEVIPRGASFLITIELENPEDADLAMVGAALAEWENGVRLGGFTSRGLGQVKLIQKKVEQVNYSIPDQLRAYLLKGEMSQEGGDSLLKNSLDKFISRQGGSNA
jgi:CRISPR-associated RAMP protein (TIGR02581 family)